MTSAGFADVVITTRTEPVIFDGGPPQFVQVRLPSAIGDEIRALDATTLERLTAALTNVSVKRSDRMRMSPA